MFNLRLTSLSLKNASIQEMKKKGNFKHIQIQRTFYLIRFSAKIVLSLRVKSRSMEKHEVSDPKATYPHLICLNFLGFIFCGHCLFFFRQRAQNHMAI